MAVVLSELTLYYVASITSFSATRQGSYSVYPPMFKNSYRANTTHSQLEKRSYRPSLAKIMKSVSSNYAILISGQHRTKSVIFDFLVFSSNILICLHSKSPNALVTASLPNTLPKTIQPPDYFILSCSSFLDAF